MCFERRACSPSVLEEVAGLSLESYRMFSVVSCYWSRPACRQRYSALRPILLVDERCAIALVCSPRSWWVPVNFAPRNLDVASAWTLHFWNTGI